MTSVFVLCTCSFEHGDDLRAERHGNVEVEAREDLGELVERVVTRLQEEVGNVGAEEEDPARCRAAVCCKQKTRPGRTHTASFVLCSVPKDDALGNVSEISLTTVKVLHAHDTTTEIFSLHTLHTFT